MSAPSILVVLVSGLAACGDGGAGSKPGGEPAGRAPNVLLISIDTLRPDHLGCYGHELPTSPALDALAARGARFTDVTAAAPWTLPSHATMLTGLYPSHHGVKSHETRLADATVTLAEELRDHGFRTLAVVNTWNVGAPQFQLGQGFEQFQYVPERERAEAGAEIENSGREVLAKARAALEEGGGTRPFFLFLHFYDVHSDFAPRPKYREQFVAPYQGRVTGRTQQLVGLRNRGERLTEEDLRFLRELYDAEIRQLDDQLARFLAWLDERGWLAGTLIAVTSDHGEEFQEHGGFLHGRTQYQELLRVPLILAGPGVPAGLVLDAAAGGVDVAPTLLALAGVRSSVPRDGCDLSVLWRGGTLPERALFGEADHSNKLDGETVLDVKAMVRRGHDKLHLDRPSGATALYDLARDPREQHDLAAEHPELVEALRAELARFDAGARAGEAIAAPTPEERELLDQLGYGGEEGGDGADR